MLLSQSALKDTGVAENVGANEENKVLSIAIERLVVGEYQPRRFFSQEALLSLAESIRSQGIIQPIVARLISRDGKQVYEILAGERRWRAAQLAGLQKVPVVLKKLTDQEALVVALIENIQREDLNPIETADAIQRLIDEFQLTHNEAGELLGRSRSTITNTLRLLDLSATVQQFLFDGKVDMGHARALLSLPVEKQNEVANLIIEQGLTVRETEALVRRYINGGSEKATVKARQKDPDVASLEKKISEYLGAVTTIKERAHGRGEVQIKYNSLDELVGILEKIKQSD